MFYSFFAFFFFKQKTAYEMRISDWSSDVCSSDLPADDHVVEMRDQEQRIVEHEIGRRYREHHPRHPADHEGEHERDRPHHRQFEPDPAAIHREQRSEEHTSELQSLMRLSYAVFCLKKKHKLHYNENNRNQL